MCSLATLSPVLVVTFSIPRVERVLPAARVLGARRQDDGSGLQRSSGNFGNVACHPYLYRPRTRGGGGDHDPGEEDIDVAQIA